MVAGVIKGSNKMSISEMVFITVVSVTMGVIWWGYTFIYDLLSPFLRTMGLEGLLTGFWYMGGVFFGYIIRKPGSALFGELIACVIEGMISHWGLAGTLLYGFVQGISVEILFLLVVYKKWNTSYLAIVGAMSGMCAGLLSIYVYQYYKIGITYSIIQVVSTAVSGFFLAGIFAKWLADKIARTGVLNQFNIAKASE